MLKVMIIVVLFMVLANLIQFICWKILCLVIVDLYKMHLKEIDTKKGVYNYYIDFLVRAKKKKK